MKNVLAVRFLVLISNCLFGQKYNGAHPSFLFGRQASANIEAMGQAATAVNVDFSFVYFNPSKISDLKGILVNK